MQPISSRAPHCPAHKVQAYPSDFSTTYRWFKARQLLKPRRFDHRDPVSYTLQRPDSPRRTELECWGTPNRESPKATRMEDRNVSDCIFCGIIQGRAAASMVYEDDSAMAFMDIRPVNPGHVLVVPKRHAAFLSELDEATTAHLFVIAKRIAAAVRRSSLRSEGINLFLADGVAAFQEVFHAHVHVIPRYHGDGFGLRFGPNYSRLPSRKDLDDAAARIRRAGGY